MIGATNDGAHLGQKRGERPNSGGFSRSPVAESEDAADRCVHRCDHEGQFHLSCPTIAENGNGLPICSSLNLDWSKE